MWCRPHCITCVFPVSHDKIKFSFNISSSCLNESAMCGTQLCNVRMWGSVNRNVWLALLTVAKLSPEQRSDMPQISDDAGPHCGEDEVCSLQGCDCGWWAEVCRHF